MKKIYKNYKVSYMTQIAIMSALALALLFIIPGGGWPIFPVAPWLKYDLLDIPVLIAAVSLGIGPALIILAIVSAIQSLLFGASGWVGFIMHFIASGTLVSVVALIYHRWRNFKSLILACISGGLAMALLMGLVNLYIVPYIYPITYEQALSLVVVNFSFNIIKAGLNSIFAIIIWKAIMPQISKYLS